MLGWIARIFFVIAGFITSFFISHDQLNFGIIQMIIAVFLFTLTIAVAAFWPSLTSFFTRKKKRK